MGLLEAQLIKDHQIPVIGLDIVGDMLLRAKANDLDCLILADAHTTPFRQASFDLVMFPESIMNMRIEEVIQEAKRVLKPEGILLIINPAPYRLRLKERICLKLRRWQNKTKVVIPPFRLITFDEFTVLLFRLGFKTFMIERKFWGDREIYIIIAHKTKGN